MNLKTQTLIPATVGTLALLTVFAFKQAVPLGQNYKYAAKMMHAYLPYGKLTWYTNSTLAYICPGDKNAILKTGALIKRQDWRGAEQEFRHIKEPEARAYTEAYIDLSLNRCNPKLKAIEYEKSPSLYDITYWTVARAFQALNLKIQVKLPPGGLADNLTGANRHIPADVFFKNWITAHTPPINRNFERITSQHHIGVVLENLLTLQDPTGFPGPGSPPDPYPKKLWEDYPDYPSSWAVYISQLDTSSKIFTATKVLSEHKPEYLRCYRLDKQLINRFPKYQWGYVTLAGDSYGIHDLKEARLAVTTYWKRFANNGKYNKYMDRLGALVHLARPPH